MRTTVDFLLHHWLKVDELTSRPRFTDHSRETFAAVLDNAEQIAADKYAPFNRAVDNEEPHTETNVDGTLRVVLPRATHDAWNAYAGSGMLAAAQDYEHGGMQLPYVVEASANMFFSRASISISWALLTTGNANAIMAHGTQAQKEVFAKNEFAGRWAGTMCLSEPQAGSSLSDISTRAVLDDENDALGPRYRLFGNKMWISGGEHDVTENIVHLVLAKIPDADGKLIPGTRGISLFIVPKFLPLPLGEVARSAGEGKTTTDEKQTTDFPHRHYVPPLPEGEGSTRNDVVLAGLNHKLGWRGTPNTLLNFGEGKFKPLGKAGAVGYLVGKPGDGLRCMFHMMNEARIGIGLAATMLGMAGYEASLQYAKDRKQGRPVTGDGKDSSKPPVALIEHADIKRMLLAQKSYCEGATALLLYCAKLVDETHTGSPDSAAEAKLLLEVLTPIAKSWPSENCLEANSLAIQIHGGYGYTRDFPVEQYWRDNRLNMIHEGTHGIQAMDLLGRKVVMEGGKGLMLLATKINETIQRAMNAPSGQQNAELADHAHALARALQSVGAATKAAWSTGNPNEALANAVPYMQAFGHLVLAWVWLDVSLSLWERSRVSAGEGNANSRHAAGVDFPHPPFGHPLPEGEGKFREGKLAACNYFFRYELPKIDGWLAPVKSRDMTCANVSVDAL
ncbi:MAG: acyl-CoA dehydrogenase [Burkholderiales bacterium]|nr:MAG: acyl-CoA dehydrogenase [Burkholderiales bacterium]